MEHWKEVEKLLDEGKVELAIAVVLKGMLSSPVVSDEEGAVVTGILNRIDEVLRAEETP